MFEALGAAGVPLATVVHATATVAPSACVGEGSVVFAHAVINADTCIGKNVIVNTSVSVDHDNCMADHVHLSPGVHTGERSWLARERMWELGRPFETTFA